MHEDLHKYVIIYNCLLFTADLIFRVMSKKDHLDPLLFLGGLVS